MHWGTYFILWYHPQMSQSKKPEVVKFDPVKNRLNPQRAQKILNLMADGYTADEIACKLGGNKPRSVRRWKGWIRDLVASSPEYQAWQHGQAQAILSEAVPEAALALSKRAARGRPDAIKLLFEASGFHNPRVKHEHSGDIEIKFSVPVPRPERQETQTVGQAQLEEPVVDADVVEE